jgi:hypothetical protein
MRTNRTKLLTELVAPARTKPLRVEVVNPMRRNTDVRVTTHVTVQPIGGVTTLTLPPTTRAVAFWTDKYARITFDGSTPAVPDDGHYLPGNTRIIYHLKPGAIVRIADAGTQVNVSFYT